MDRYGRSNIVRVLLTPFSVKTFVDFKEVLIGKKSTRQIILDNPKGNVCYVEITEGPSGTFRVDKASRNLTIGAESTAEITVEWEPNVPGQFFEILRIKASTVKSDIMVKLVGTCLSPPQPRLTFLEREKMNCKYAKNRAAFCQQQPSRSAIKTRSGKKYSKVGRPVESPRADSLAVKRVMRPMGTPAFNHRGDQLTGRCVVTPSPAICPRAARTYVKRRSAQNSRRQSAANHNKTYLVKNQLAPPQPQPAEERRESPLAIPHFIRASGSILKESCLRFMEPGGIDISPICKPESPHLTATTRLTQTKQNSVDEGFKDGSTLSPTSELCGSLSDEPSKHPDLPDSAAKILQKQETISMSFSPDEYKQLVISEIRTQFQEQLEVLKKEMSSLCLKAAAFNGKHELNLKTVATSTDDINFAITCLTAGEFPKFENAMKATDKSDDGASQAEQEVTMCSEDSRPMAEKESSDSVSCVAMNLRRKKTGSGKAK